MPIDIVRRQGGDRRARLLGVAGEPRPDATGDTPCGEADRLRAPGTDGRYFLVDLEFILSIVVSIVYKSYPRGMKPFSSARRK